MEEIELLEGIILIPTPGHSPGSISVRVSTDVGMFLIAGDAVNIYEILEGDPKQNLQFKPLAIYTDQIAAWRSLGLIGEKVKHDHSKVLPGHDLAVFNKKRYP